MKDRPRLPEVPKPVALVGKHITHGLPELGAPYPVGVPLLGLRATLLKHDADGSKQVNMVDEADSVSFACPCGSGHRIYCWFKGRGPALLNVRGWQPTGYNIANLSLTAPGKPGGPVLRTSGGCWEGTITSGRAVTV